MLLTVSAMTPDILPKCTDKLQNCGDYDMSMCRDPKYQAWAADNCALYCGMCGTLMIAFSYKS